MMLRCISLVPGVERAAHRVAQRALDLVLRHVAVAAVDLHRVERRLDERLADEQLGHRGVQRGAPRVLEAPGGAVGEQPRRLELHLHVGDAVRDRLELADRLAELRARARVGDRRLQQPLHRADVAREQADPLPVHGRGEHGGPGPDAAEHRLGRNVEIVEDELADRRGAQAHLLELRAGGEARRAALHEERRHAAVIALLGIGHREHDHDVGDRAVRDERLRAVDAEARRRRGSARVRSANASEPEPGSVIACTPISVPLHRPGR